MAVLRLRKEGLRWREIEGDVVAVDLDTSTYLSANRSGAVLWQALEEGTTRDELVARLALAFDVDEQRAGADVDAFLRELEGQGLLVEEEES